MVLAFAVFFRGRFAIEGLINFLEVAGRDLLLARPAAALLRVARAVVCLAWLVYAVVGSVSVA